MNAPSAPSTPWWKVFNPAHFTILFGMAGIAFWVNDSIKQATWEVGQLQEQVGELTADLRALTSTVNTTGADVRVLKSQVERIERSTNLTMLETP